MQLFYNVTLHYCSFLHTVYLFCYNMLGECTYYATVEAMESRFKAAYAVRPFGQQREFNIRLSANHLKSMVQKYYNSKEGASAKGSDRLEICLRMAQLHGVMSEEDFEEGPRSGAKVIV